MVGAIGAGFPTTMMCSRRFVSGQPMSSADERDEHQSPVPGPRILGELAADLRTLIEEARLRVARSVNADLVVL